jgi:hypothetical protein
MSLESLDISYTKGLKPMSFVPFFEALAHNTKLRRLNLAYCNFIEDQDIAISKLTNQVTLYRRLVRMQEAAAKKNKPGQKPITVDNVLAEIAKEKAILNGSPVKKRNVPGGKAKIGEDIHPLKPMFEVLDPDHDLNVRNLNEAERPGSPKSPSPHKMVKPGRAGRLYTPPPPEKPKPSFLGKFGSAMKGRLNSVSKNSSISHEPKEPEPEP